MNGKRQKTIHQQQQLLLAFAMEGRDEIHDSLAEGAVPILADASIESLTISDGLMERICDSLNLEISMAPVIASDGPKQPKPKPKLNGCVVTCCVWLRRYICPSSLTGKEARRQSSLKTPGQDRKIRPAVFSCSRQQRLHRISREQFHDAECSTSPARRHGRGSDATLRDHQESRI